jgi:hypothetical protein
MSYDDEIECVPQYNDYFKIAYRNGEIQENITTVKTPCGNIGKIVDVKFLRRVGTNIYRPKYMIKFDDGSFTFRNYDQFEIFH